MSSSCNVESFAWYHGLLLLLLFFETFSLIYVLRLRRCRLRAHFFYPEEFSAFIGGGRRRRRSCNKFFWHLLVSTAPILNVRLWYLKHFSFLCDKCVYFVCCYSPNNLSLASYSSMKFYLMLYCCACRCCLASILWTKNFHDKEGFRVENYERDK